MTEDPKFRSRGDLG